MNSRYLDFVFLLHFQKDGFRTLTISLALRVHTSSLVWGGAAGTWEVDTCTKIGWWDEWRNRTELMQPLATSSSPCKTFSRYLHEYEESRRQGSFFFLFSYFLVQEYENGGDTATSTDRLKQKFS